MKKVKVVAHIIDKEDGEKIRAEVEKLLEENNNVQNIAFLIFEKYDCVVSIHHKEDITYINIF